MRPLATYLAGYTRYHRHPVNRACHFVGVPAITLSLMFLLHWLPLPWSGAPTAAQLGILVVCGWYMALDAALGSALVLVFCLMLGLAIRLAPVADAAGWSWFWTLFVGGWIFQLLGHGFEGKRPALLDNAVQIFVAPLFLAAEVAMGLGYRKDLRDALDELLQDG